VEVHGLDRLGTTSRIFNLVFLLLLCRAQVSWQNGMSGQMVTTGRASTVLSVECLKATPIPKLISEAGRTTSCNEKLKSSPWGKIYSAWG
jgi:hypothetical protein